MTDLFRLLKNRTVSGADRSTAGMDIKCVVSAYANIFACLAIALIGLYLVLLSPKLSADNSRPNVILIVADDLGWNDVGFNGSDIRTPHLDQLANDGVQLERFYVQPSCSPTRSELMTGQSAISLGVISPFSKQQPAGVPESHRFLPQFFQSAGYQTFMVGKWHLGFRAPRFRPNARGFDHFYGHVTGGIGYWDHVNGGGLDWQRNGKTLREQGYTTHLMRDEAVRLIEKRDKARPFFLYLAFNAPHLPGEAPEASLAQYSALSNRDRQLHAAMVTEMDAAIGTVMQSVSDQGISKDTLIWFLSDNGGLNPSFAPEGIKRVMAYLDELYGDEELPLQILEFVRVNMLHGAGDNAPLRAGKQSVYEGGIRVPAVVSWPGTLPPARYNGVVSALDVLPTLLSASGISADGSDLAGGDRWYSLAEGADSRVSDYHVIGLDGEAMVSFPWKLVMGTDGSTQLYNLEADPSETLDVATLHPARVDRLVAAIDSAPRAEPINLALWTLITDPDFFGGEEDRPPWTEIE
ncbi:MAG: arylsulfatase [Pseudomonadota bacterium]